MSGYLSFLLFKIFFVLLCFLMFRKKERTHDEARLLICAACGEKDLVARPVTPALEEIIKEEIYIGYNRSDSCYPASVCGTCRKNLFKSKQNEIVPVVVRDRWTSMDYESYQCPSRSTPCQCRICKKVRYHGKSLDDGDEPDVPRKASSLDENHENQAKKE